MIRWVFLDVGNILLDEDPIAYHCTRLHWEAVRNAGSALTLLDLIEARELRSMAGSRWPLYEVVSSLIDESACTEAWNLAEREIRGRYSEYSPPINGAHELIRRLVRRFKLGIIANQGTECRAWLDELGLLTHFEVVCLSEEVGRYKPDPMLYLQALESAGATPEESVMIGDRLDNDISPAGILGMATIWVSWPERALKGWQPNDPDAIAFLNSLQKISTQALGRYDGPPPTLSVNRLHEIDPDRVAGLSTPRG